MSPRRHGARTPVRIMASSAVLVTQYDLMHGDDFVVSAAEEIALHVRF